MKLYSRSDIGLKIQDHEESLSKRLQLRYLPVFLRGEFDPDGWMRRRWWEAERRSWAKVFGTEDRPLHIGD